MAPENPQKVTYWYHPESDSYWMHNPVTDPPLENLGDGLSYEVTEYQYVVGVIESIDQDPEHKLPEGITAVIKNAAEWPGKRISGFIWYDVHKRFVDNYPVNTSDIIAKEPGGIYCTKNHKYLVLMIQPQAQEASDQNG